MTLDLRPFSLLLYSPIPLIYDIGSETFQPFTILPYTIHHSPAFLICAIPAAPLHAWLTNAWQGHVETCRANSL